MYTLRVDGLKLLFIKLFIFVLLFVICGSIAQHAFNSGNVLAAVLIIIVFIGVVGSYLFGVFDRNV